MIKTDSKTPMYKKGLFQYLFIMCSCLAHASSLPTNRIFTPLVHTLQIICNDDWLQQPVIVLDSDDYVAVSFDYFSHEYHRLCFHLEHCNSDGSPSDLMPSEFMEGFNDQPIDYYLNSLNTTFQYTHYALNFPNDNVSLKVSGNYRVLVFDEESDAKPSAEQPDYKGHPILAEACFQVLEPLVTVSASVTSNTDIDTYASHQQVSFLIAHPDYTIERPEQELKVIVSQNNRPDMTVTGIQPTYIRPGMLEYEHNRNLVFQGNNEFRRFEVINMHYGSQNVDRIDFYEPYYHAVLMPDVPRRAYSFDADHNGRFLVRYNLAEDVDTEADYFFAHFSLSLPYPLEDGNLYVTGSFSNYSYSDNYRMSYNTDTHTYECAVLLKMGAYDYQYVFVPDEPFRLPRAVFDGSFYETENEYVISVYHRPFGSRYDKLIAVETIHYAQE